MEMDDVIGLIFYREYFGVDLSKVMADLNSEISGLTEEKIISIESKAVDGLWIVRAWLRR